MLEVGKKERTQACRRNRCRCLKITLVVIVMFLVFVICLFVGSELEMKAVRKADDTGKITFPRCGFSDGILTPPPFNSLVLQYHSSLRHCVRWRFSSF
jgi:hypothetical protein